MDQLRILVVDDYSEIRLLVQRFLGAHGYSVFEVPNGIAAVELVLAQPPGYFAVIIIDSRMPGLSGLDVARRIQAARPGQRMLHVTGNPEDLSDERFAELGLQTLAKPLRARELKAAVEAALG